MGNCGSNSNDSKDRYQLANPYSTSSRTTEKYIRACPWRTHSSMQCFTSYNYTHC